MQRHTLKLLLKQNKENSLGQLPIYLRITVNRKVSFISTGYFILPKWWDARNEAVKAGYSLSVEINTDITNKKKEVLQSLVHSGVRRESASAKSVKAESKVNRNNFFDFAAANGELLKSKRAEATGSNWTKHLKKLETYHGSRILSFEEITTDYLEAFEQYLRTSVQRRKGDGSNYINAIMRTVRRFFNAAIKKGIITHYPFKNYEMPAYTPADKDHLTLSELDRWEAFVKEATGQEKEVGLWFLFGCYTGLRISDWYLFDMKMIEAGEVRVRAKKNGEWVMMPVHARLKKLLPMLQKTPLKTPEPTLNRELKNIAAKAKIDKYLSSHSARKSYAVTICLERGISSETAAELMGITLAVFINNYSKVTGQKIRQETEKAWRGL